jgi:hypothetical protein
LISVIQAKIGLERQATWSAGSLLFLWLGSASRGSKKATVPSGKAVSLASMSAKVAVAVAANVAQAKVVVKRGLKRPRARAKDDVVEFVSSAVLQITPTHEEWKAARKVVITNQKNVSVKRNGGISLNMQAQIAEQNTNYSAGAISYVRKSKDVLMREGAIMDVSFQCLCYASSLCLKKEALSNKGSKGKLLVCTLCKRKYHKKCVVTAKHLEEEATFTCFACLHEEIRGGPDSEDDD